MRNAARRIVSRISVRSDASTVSTTSVRFDDCRLCRARSIRSSEIGTKVFAAADVAVAVAAGPAFAADGAADVVVAKDDSETAVGALVAVVVVAVVVVDTAAVAGASGARLVNVAAVINADDGFRPRFFGGAAVATSVSPIVSLEPATSLRSRLRLLVASTRVV